MFIRRDPIALNLNFVLTKHKETLSQKLSRFYTKLKYFIIYNLFIKPKIQTTKMTIEHLYTFLWAMAPLLELRASIPLGYLQFGLSLTETILISFAGSMFSTAIVLWLLPSLIDFAERYIPWFNRIMQRILHKTRAQHSKKIAVLGETFLIGFVAIPVPGSGAWTGILICYLFGIPYKKAIILIATGVFISAILISLITLFGHGVWQMLFDAPEQIITPLINELEVEPAL